MRNYNLLVLFFLFLTPILSAQERGIASYYSDSFQGRKTASGEKYDKSKMTGAHKTLPFGTIVQVTRVDDGRSVKIRINDLGPYISGRIVELSGKAGEALGLYEDGLAEVTVKVLGKRDQNPSFADSQPATAPSSSLPPTPTLKVPSSSTAKSATPKTNVPPSKPLVTDNKLVERGPEKPKSYDKPKKIRTPEVKEKATRKRKAAPEKSGVLALEPASKFTTGKSYKIEVLEHNKKTVLYGVQVAAVKDIDGMMNLVTKYQSKWFDEVYVNVDIAKDGKPIYKLVLGAFEDKSKAENYKRSMKKRKKMDGFVVELQ